MFDNRDSIDFAHTDIRKLFNSLFFPTLLGMIFNMAFIFTDGIFIGHGIGGHGLAAINLIGPIMMLINGLGMMLGVGASVVAAVHLSHNNVKAARINITQAFITGISISILMGLVCYLFPSPIIRLLGADGGLYPYAREYYMWFMPTCLLNMITSIGLFVIRLDGNPRYAMLSNIIPAIINGILDYLFIFPIPWGLMGASLATDLGGLVGAGMVVYYVFHRAKTLRIYRVKASITSLKLMLRNVRYMVKLGISALLGEVAVSVMMLTGNIVFINHLGDDGVAAYSVACYLFPLVYMVYTAVAQAAQPIISFNHGCGNSQRVRRTLNFSLIIAVLLGLTVSAIFILFAPHVVSCFLNSEAPAYTIASSGLPYYAAGFVFMAVNICIIGYLQSIERAGASAIFTILRGIVFLISSFLILPRLIGVKGLWLAIPIAEVLTTASISILFCFSHKKTK